MCYNFLRNVKNLSFAQWFINPTLLTGQNSIVTLIKNLLLLHRQMDTASGEVCHGGRLGIMHGPIPKIIRLPYTIGGKMYKISVIIPIYNVEKYLRECLDSIVNQTLKDVEVICVDDGSPDHSAEIASEYVAKYSNFKLIHKENGGLSSARNAGLDIAHGQYIYFLDSDDYLERNALKELHTRAVADDLDMVYFNAVPFADGEGLEQTHSVYRKDYDRQGDYSGVHTGQAMFAMMRKNREFLGSSCFYITRRSLIEENGLRFYDGIIHEDNLFTFQCTILARRVGYSDRKYYNRRLRSGSTMTMRKSMQNVEGYLVSYSEMLHFLHDRPIEATAAPLISDYLRSSILGNACSIFQSLDIPSEEAVLTKGDYCASYFLDTIKAENDVLRARLREIEWQYESSFTFRVGRIVTLPLRLTKRTIVCLRENGLVFTLRKIKNTLVQKAETADERMQGQTAYRLLTYLPRQVRHNLSWVRNRGVAYACRCIRMKVHVRSHSTTPLVSIILPVYNVEPYLEQCMDSLQKQTLKSIEIIAVDDGSTDRSLEILNRYAAADKRIHVYTQKNQYAGAARNVGLSHATGEYLLFLDSDDFFSRNLAKDAYIAGKAANADIVIFGAEHYDNVTGEYCEAKWLLQEQYAPQKQPFSYKDCPGEFFHITTPCPWTKLFRRQFILDSGLQFQQIQNSNDVFFTFSALPMAKRIVTLNKPLVFYRVGLTNNLQTTKKNHPLCFYEAYLAWHDKLKELGVLDDLRQSYVNVALNNCMWNLHTMQDSEAEQAVQDVLIHEAFFSLELINARQSDYRNKEYYREMVRLVKGRDEYAYLQGLDPSKYRNALQAWFKRNTLQELNLDHPATYNEKIQWMKLNEKNPLKTQYSDKYEVRDFVRRTIGDRYLIPLLGVWERVEDIDFDTLPAKFVLKATHGSGWNIIVRDKHFMNVAEVKRKLNYWLNRNFAYCNGLELHYKDIKPRIIAEQYMENFDGELHDYKVWCFGGKAHYVQYITGRNKAIQMAYYDLDWNKLPFISDHQQYEGNVEKPSNLDEMIWAAEMLARQFNHVRVDFYSLDDGDIKFGEMTFTPASGRMVWNPPEYDRIIGDLFDLEYPNGTTDGK